MSRNFDDLSQAEKIQFMYIFASENPEIVKGTEYTAANIEQLIEQAENSRVDWGRVFNGFGAFGGSILGTALGTSQIGGSLFAASDSVQTDGNMAAQLLQQQQIALEASKLQAEKDKLERQKMYDTYKPYIIGSLVLVVVSLVSYFGYRSYKKRSA